MTTNARRTPTSNADSRAAVLTISSSATDETRRSNRVSTSNAGVPVFEPLPGRRDRREVPGQARTVLADPDGAHPREPSPWPSSFGYHTMLGDGGRQGLRCYHGQGGLRRSSRPVPCSRGGRRRRCTVRIRQLLEGGLGVGDREDRVVAAGDGQEGARRDQPARSCISPRRRMPGT